MDLQDEPVYRLSVDALKGMPWLESKLDDVMRFKAELDKQGMPDHPGSMCFSREVSSECSECSEL